MENNKLAIKYLILDDEPKARNVLHNTVSEIENTVCMAEATNIAEALQALQENEINLLFVDLDLGSGSRGYDLAEHLGEQSFLYGVIYVTAYLPSYHKKVIHSQSKYLYCNAIEKPYNVQDIAVLLVEFRKMLSDRETEKQKLRFSDSFCGFLRNVEVATPTLRKNLCFEACLHKNCQRTKIDSIFCRKS